MKPIVKTNPLVRVFALMAALFSGMAYAGLVNDVPSCYEANGIRPFSTPYDNLIYVLLDQTVQLDQELQKSVLDNTRRLMQPGTKFVIAEFSAFSQEHYLTVLHTGIIENPIPPSNLGDVVISKLRPFLNCLREQVVFAARMALETEHQIMESSASSLHHSDILQALKTVAGAVAQDSAKNKAVFVVTDGVENSSVTSFYARDSVRLIDPSTEIAKAKAADLFSDFGGARIYVLGGGVMPPATSGTTAQRDGYRNPQVLHALSTFWHAYFKSSNADLVEFGEPALVEAVSWH